MSKRGKNNDKAIECNKCQSWIHIKCNNITIKQDKNFQNNEEEIFECKNCCKCQVCNKIVASNHRAIECNICQRWVYIKCKKLDQKDYNTYQANGDKKFFCINCLTETLPLQSVNNTQLHLTTKGIDFPDEVNVDDIYLSATQLNMINNINQAIGSGFGLLEDSNDTDTENEINPIDCKCYTTDQFNEKKN